MKLENAIYCGDCLERVGGMPDECVDLIYADPPFFSNRHYEVIWSDGAEIRSFEDRWKGGIHHYIEWMKDRCCQLHRVLKSDGSLFLHCDWHAAHYLKVMLDGVFGYSRLVNEIIWCYETGGRATTRYPRKHDTILWYSKGERPRFFYSQVATPRDFSTMHETVLTDADGRRYQRNIKGGKEYRYYEDEGVLPNDWWVDISALNPADKRRLGYPTQKPPELLQRIVNSASERGDLVLDPFCGCGTTIVTAQILKRRWIGIDVSPTACKLMKRQVEAVGATGVSIIGLPMSIDELKSLAPIEFQNWIVGALGGSASSRASGDMGIDGYTFWDREPIQVKQSEHIGRPIVDDFETALRRHYQNAVAAAKERGNGEFTMKGTIVAFSFTGGAYEEVARAKQDGFDITLLEVNTVVKEFEE